MSLPPQTPQALIALLQERAEKLVTYELEIAVDWGKVAKQEMVRKDAVRALLEAALALVPRPVSSDSQKVLDRVRDLPLLLIRECRDRIGGLVTTLDVSGTDPVQTEAVDYVWRHVPQMLDILDALRDESLESQPSGSPPDVHAGEPIPSAEGNAKRDETILNPAKPQSAQPCGCDPGASWICEQHRT